MILKSFGCSFIFGSELKDKEANPKIQYPGFFKKASQYTWPSLVAKHLNYDHVCYAYPASGNLRIAESVLNQAALDERSLFIIGWTWVDRFDWTDADSKWQSITPGYLTPEANFYYKNFHSQYRDKLSTLMSVKLVIDTLRQKGHPFIMTYVDRLMFEHEWHSTPATVDLQNYIEPYLSDFNGDTFLEWAERHNFPIGKDLHPLEEAHESVANYVIENLSNFIKD